MEPSPDDIVERLEALRPRLEREYKVRIFGLFGSRARGDARPGSDLDVAYRWLFEDEGNLFDLGGVWHEINAEFGLPVSLVDWDHARESFKRRASRDLLTFHG